MTDQKLEQFPPKDSLLTTPVSFSDFLAQRIDTQGPKVGQDRINLEERLKRTGVILRSHGLAQIDSATLPDRSWGFDRFTDSSWNFVRDSEDRLMALYTLLNYDKELTMALAWPDRDTPTQEELAQFRNLPLVYGTTFETLLKIMDSGKVLSDRAFRQKMIDEGKDPEAVENWAEATTHTAEDDRRAGLDNYVFTHFGRPHLARRIYGDVEILFRPDRFYNDPRSFATEDDFIDVVDGLTRHKTEDGYRDQVMQGVGGYFLGAVVSKLKQEANTSHRGAVLPAFLSGRTDTHDQYGRTTFSTWEVKVPELTTDEIAKIVFSNLEQMTRFREIYGDRFQLIYRPGLRELREVLNKIGVKDTSKYTDSHIEGWAQRFFAEHPDMKQQMFGDADITFDPTKIYPLEPQGQDAIV